MNRKSLLIINYSLILISLILLFTINFLFIIGLLFPLFIAIYLQLFVYNKKNHIALKIFYIITLMIFYPLEKIVEYSIRKKYNKIAPKILNMINGSGIKFHAVYGTFLFMYRNNSFMDNDIDIAVWEKDWNKSNIKVMNGLGFTLEETYLLDGEIKEYCFKHKKLKASLDIFLLKKNNPKAYGFDPNNNRYATKPYDYKYETKTYNINGTKILGPSKPNEYLEWIYGDWKNKDPNYHWLHGSSIRPNIIIKSEKIKVIKKY